MEVFSLLPARTRGGTVLHVPQGPFHKLVLCPFILGGDTYILPRPIDLHAVHFDQKSKVHNTALWNLYPWDLVDPVMNDATMNRLATIDSQFERQLGRYDNNDNRAGVPHGHMRITANMLTLILIFDTLSIHGFMDGPPKADRARDAVRWRRALQDNVTQPTPQLPSNYGASWVHPRERKRMNTVAPVRDLVKRLKAKKKVVTNVLLLAGNPIEAAREYAKLLMELYPWTASPLLFTHAEAFNYGIAQLESELWVSLGIASLKAGRLTNHYQWYTAAKDCSDAILNMRYTTFGALSKAGFFAHEAHAFHHRVDPAPLGAFGTLMLNPAVMPINGYIMGQTFLLEDKNDGASAHKACYDRHRCQDRQNEGTDLMEAKIGDPIMCPQGANGPLVLHTDFTVNN